MYGLGLLEDLVFRIEKLELLQRNKKLVICYSGGHSSGLCAIEAVRRVGKENVILLNHDITSKVEDQDIKRFKNQVSEYLDLPITYVNHEKWDTSTPIDVCMDAGAWKVGNGQILCTNRLKTSPFNKWLNSNPESKNNIYIYGFDNSPRERNRANRRSQILGLQGYETEYPLINWVSTIRSTLDIGINPPMFYEKFNHANCIGCLKAGWQHWYIVYCERPDIWEEGKFAEEEIGYAIHQDRGQPVYLEDKEELFMNMKKAGVEPTEKVNQSKFWNDAKRRVKEHEELFNQMMMHDESVCIDCTV